jgi:hypothetical protein
VVQTWLLSATMMATAPDRWQNWLIAALRVECRARMATHRRRGATGMPCLARVSNRLRPAPQAAGYRVVAMCGGQRGDPMDQCRGDLRGHANSSRATLSKLGAFFLE